MTANRFGDKRMQQLHSVAWAILLSGIIGAALSWTTIDDVQAGVTCRCRQPEFTALRFTARVCLPGTGALGFAFFWVSSLISRQLKEIRRLLLTHPMPVMALNEPGENRNPHRRTGI